LPVHSCKLTGRIEGDHIVLRAEFTFSTQQPRASVVLGMQASHLVDEGDLDKTVPQLDYGDDGFVVRVDKEGPHQLALNLKVPLGLKRATGLANAAERGFELGLPGAPATTADFGLACRHQKTCAVNRQSEKGEVENALELTLGPAKQVAIAWKEPLAQPAAVRSRCWTRKSW